MAYNRVMERAERAVKTGDQAVLYTCHQEMSRDPAVKVHKAIKGQDVPELMSGARR